MWGLFFSDKTILKTCLNNDMIVVGLQNLIAHVARNSRFCESSYYTISSTTYRTISKAIIYVHFFQTLTNRYFLKTHAYYYTAVRITLSSRSFTDRNTILIISMGSKLYC